MQNNIKNLLPVGFHDILPPHAGEEFSIINQLINHFVKFGYEQIKPTMIEFDDYGLSKLKKKQSFQSSLAHQSFLVMDPHSKEMVKIRSDMTIQIARIARMRLNNVVRPLRLSYSGQALRVTGRGLNAERQITQTGIELIGSGDIKNSVIEVITVALSSFEKLGLQNISIDFNIAGLAESIMNDNEVAKHKRNEIYNLIDSKNISALSKINCQSVKLMIELINSAGSADKCLNILDKITLSKKATENIKSIKEINDFLKENFKNVSITIDPIERMGFEYHSDISFSIFSKENNEELGRGGHYDIGEKISESAIGFTLNINEIARIYKSRQERKKILVPQKTSIDELQNLHKKGYNTVKFFESDINERNIEQIAKDLKCGFIFFEGEIITIEASSKV